MGGCGTGWSDLVDVGQTWVNGEGKEAVVMPGERPNVTELLKRIESLERAVEDLRAARRHSDSSPLASWRKRQTAKRSIEAEEFIVLDSSGTRRAKLAVGSDGWARLRLYDQTGERCASLGVAPDGSARLRFYDQTGTTRAGLAVGSDLGGGLVLKDQSGNVRVTLALPDDGRGDLRILDEDGKTLFKAP